MSAEKSRQQTRWGARQLAIMALLGALGAVLSFIPIPIFPPAAVFGITYEPTNIPAIIGGLAFGPVAGVIIGVVSSVIHGFFVADVVGTVMNCIVVVAFVVPTCLIYQRGKTTTSLLIGLLVGSLVSVAFIIPANLVVWPLYYGLPFDETVTYIVPIMLPFNLMKAGLNALLSFILYKSLYKLIEGKQSRT